MVNHNDPRHAKIIVVRRLAAVLSADAVGYSRLMGQDELGTVRTIIGHRDVIGEVVQRLRGVVVDSAGDNVLAQFASAVDAVECAVDIQRALAMRNAALAVGRRLEFRIGVNAGRILMEGTRIYGDTVNVAARIQPLAAPVCARQASDGPRTTAPSRGRPRDGSASSRPRCAPCRLVVPRRSSRS